MKAWQGMIAACALALGACGLPWETASGGSATETTGGAKVTGMVVYPDGGAAAGAWVSVRAAAWSGDTSVDTGEVVRVAAGKDGSFRIDTLASGDYLLVAGDDKGNLAMAEFRTDSERKTRALKADTLRPSGGIEGSFAKGPRGGEADAGEVEVFGLGRRARADASGAFRIESLPAGRVRLRPRSSRSHLAYADTAAIVVPAQTAALPPFAPRVSEDYASWASSRRILIDVGGAGVDSTVRDFPLAVRMTGGIIDLPGNGGRDLRFTDAQGRPLAYALQTWAPEDNYAMAWVRMDSLKGGVTTSIRMYWGKPDAPDLSDPAAVFPDFAGVWNLHDSIGPSGEGVFADLSPAGAHAQGKVDPGKGEVLYPGGQGFSGSHGISAPAASALEPVDGLFISVWAKLDALDSAGAVLAAHGGNYGLQAAPGGKVVFYLQTGGGYVDLDTDDSVHLGDGEWHHYAGSYADGVMRAYCDGIEFMSTVPRAPIVYPKPGILRMGAGEAAGSGLTGRLAGVSVSPRGRSRSWIRLYYLNQRPNSGLVSFLP